MPEPSSGEPSTAMTATKAGSARTIHIPPSPGPGALTGSTRGLSQSPTLSSHKNQTALKSSASDSDMPGLIESDQDNFNAEYWTTLEDELSSAVPINERDTVEENRWWDANLRAQRNRPGPGLLPESLFANIGSGTHPNLYTIEISTSSNSPDSSMPQSQATEESASSRVPQSPRATTLPSAAELMLATPHPKAFYQPDANSWFILEVQFGPIPITTDSFNKGAHKPLPEHARRSRARNCLSNSVNNGTANLSHHLHRYKDAVSVETIFQDFVPNNWNEHSGFPVTLDLYICCQCSLYIAHSRAIPGIIPGYLLHSLIADRMDHPLLGKTGAESAISALDILQKVVENNVWKGETRSLSLNGKSFQKLGLSQAVIQIFEKLDYVFLDSIPERVAKPPSLDESSRQGTSNRAKLLRAWAEINAFISHLQHRQNKANYAIVSQNVTERLRSQLGISTSTYGADLADVSSLEAWKTLGLGPLSFSAELCEFAYRAQCRCDPENTPSYLTAVKALSEALPAKLLSQSALLENLLATEYSRGRWTEDHLSQAAMVLGFGRDNELGLEWNSDIEDSFAIAAWKDKMRRAWTDPLTSTRIRRQLTEALKTLAEERGSIKIMQAIGDENIEMSPEQAYRALEVPQDVEEEMLLMVFHLRIEDQPHQINRMRQALTCIAEYTESSRLRAFLRTGLDPGHEPTAHPLEWPRGLNQLGNTCYLNSLLQYFYTIKDLRQAVTSLRDGSHKKVGSGEMTEWRVGGRLISKREIERSKRFVFQLASLFNDLESSRDSSVTPSLELAKLALVTSKDEDEDDAGERQTGTDSSNSTDATLVDEPMAVVADGQADPQNPSTSAPSLSTTQLTSDTDMLDATVLEGHPPLPPRKKPPTVPETGMLFGKQHDVAECMDNCLFQIEAALVDGDEDPANGSRSLVKTLFYGKLRQRLTPIQDSPARSDSLHVRDDIFSHLPVNVCEEGLDLYDGLCDYFHDDVEFETKKAKMDMTLVGLPPILQIQLQRVQFDRETSQTFKSHAYVKFGETLVMDRFLESADPSKKVQAADLHSNMKSLRERVKLLTESRRAPFTEHLSIGCGFLSTMNGELGGSEASEFLRDESERLRVELERTRDQLRDLKGRMELLWLHECEAQYDLTSVFIHRGSSASWGHYFFYTRHLPEHPDSWFKMNDSEVSVVSKEEVLADTASSTANAYLLVYARKGSGVIETVRRETTPIKDVDS